MKLWQAIEKGSKGATQTHNTFVDRDGAVCAQGAALKAIGKLGNPFTTDHHAIMAETWPELAVRVEKCPAGCDLYGPLVGGRSRLVAHLNNHHHWPFHLIINWLRGVEGDEQP